MLVAEAVGRALAALGRGHVFGLMGSGNLAVTNALRDAGARFTPRATRAARSAWPTGTRACSGRVAACSVHQGPGLTNAVTGADRGGEEPHAAARARAARRRPRRCARTSASIRRRSSRPSGRSPSGCTARRAALADTARAVRRAHVERRPVVLMLPLDVQAARVPDGARAAASARRRAPPRAGRAAVAGARRPARRARTARDRRRPRRGARRRRRARCGRSASAPAPCSPRAPWPTGCSPAIPCDLGISGGFASPAGGAAARRVRRGARLRRRAEPVDDGPRRADRRRAPPSSRSTSTPTRSARTGRSASA